ncbi:alpha-amylase [uncultured Bifidobacterium sp.]|uniref:alpha-amylase n=1 Tax=uncultured Bifidobacterium sp. TaxID=165187 RepID=UPI00258BDAEF|nr:alpha-amylase [uncultured Bifidobacterium sp.]MEE0654491.1 alpha-amylase [Bifidobacterium criceti]
MTAGTANHETMLQCFEWYLPDDHGLWNWIAAQAEDLAAAGFTMAWLPPAYKGQAGDSDVGYGVYDMYDLGEFDAKGSVQTKYGSRGDYLGAIRTLRAQGLHVLADIVFNHRMGADGEERVTAHVVDVDDRTVNDSTAIERTLDTVYDFPERDGAYSTFRWNWRDFTGTDYTANDGSTGIMRFAGKQWSDNVSHECGNYDYIMGDDVDVNEPEVVKELTEWGVWYTETTGVDGFRLDAVKSIDAKFFAPWLKTMRHYGNHPDFAVGEYWSGDVDELTGYLDDCGHCMTLFDVALHFAFEHISHDPASYDLRSLAAHTLTGTAPSYACAFVDNHDTQPGQALESWVEPWFKPLAYAYILLRDSPYPCVFFGDWYGIPHDCIPPVPLLHELVWIRAHLLGGRVIAQGGDTAYSLCWAVRGDHPVCVMLNTGDAAADRHIQEGSFAAHTFVDICHPDVVVQIDAAGRCVLQCPPRACSIYIDAADYEVMRKALESGSMESSHGKAQGDDASYGRAADDPLRERSADMQ